MIRKIHIIGSDRSDTEVEIRAGKRMYVPWANGRVLFLVPFAFYADGYLTEVVYTVYDYGSGVLVGGGKTKAAALTRARQNLSDRLRWRNRFMYGRAKLNAYRLQLDNQVADFLAYKESMARDAAHVAPRKKRIFFKDGGKCHYCKVELTLEGDWEADHYHPRSKGGSDHLSNMVAACKSCKSCNQKKRTLHGDEFKKLFAGGK